MKKSIFVLLVTFVAASCVDSNYDLSKVDSDNIAIGNDDSEFLIPLATFNYPVSSLTSDAGSSSAGDVFDETDTWLPDSAADSAEGVDIKRLAADADYRETFLNALFDQCTTDGVKLSKIAKLVSQKYASDFIREMGLPTTPDDLQQTVQDLFSDPTYRAKVTSILRNIDNGYLEDITFDSISYPIDAINISAEVLDMITANIDGTEGGKLYIYGSLNNSFPIDFLVAPSFTDTQINFGNLNAAYNKEQIISEKRISATDIRKIINGETSIEVPIQLLRYYPQKFGNDNAFSITLRLRKTGALIFK